MNILHTNFHKHMVGESRRILTICLGLRDRGHTVLVATPKNSKLLELAERAGLRVICTPEFRRGFRPVSMFKDIFSLRKAILENNVEIIHTHGSADTWSGTLAARLSLKKMRVVRTRHNHFPVARHLPNRWLYQKLIDRLIVISEHVRAGFTQDDFVPPERTSLIHSSVDTDTLNAADYDGRKFRKELGISPDEQLVGMVSFINLRKGHKYFLEAAQKIIKAQNVTVKFVIVGDGEGWLEEELKAWVRKAGLEEWILFTGIRHDIPWVLAALDVFVLPTLEEALGLSLVEALAMRKAVVATRVGGVPEVVRHRETGLLVPPKDPESLCEAITELLRDRNLAGFLADNGRKLVEERFSIKNMTDKTETVYRRVLHDLAE